MNESPTAQAAKPHYRTLWLVLLGAAGAFALTMGVRQTMGLFLSALNTSTALGVGSISLAFAFGQLWWGLTQPFAGAAADRIGTGRVILIGVVLVAIGTIITPLMSSTAGLIFAIGVLAAGGAGMAGPSVLMGATTRLVAPEKRGLATGIVNAGGSFGQFAMAPIAIGLTAAVGWAGAMQWLGVLVLLALPAAWLLRGNSNALAAQAAAASGKKALTAREAIGQAMGTPSYRYLALGFLVCGFHVAFLATHLPSVIAACGLPAEVGGWALGIIGLFNIVGSLAMGWAVGRWRMKSLLSLLYAARGLAVLIFLFAPKTTGVMLVFAAVMGVTFLSTVPPTAGLVAKMFGPANMAMLFGIVMLAHQVGGFLGAFLGGYIFQATGSYDWVWYIDIMLAVGAALVHLPIREAMLPARTAKGGGMSTDKVMDPRTRMLLEAPIVPTLLKLAAPNILVMVAQAATGLIETYFVGKLGLDALAGMALVFPIVMLMQMTSAGAMGGGIASAIARALGGGRRADADALVLHAMVIALGFGVVFTLALLLGGRWLYTLMGGSGEALEAALVYSNWVFVGAILVWLFNSLAAVVRGTGNMAVPAYVTVAGVVFLVPASPLLIFGWGPIPGMGIAGGAAALLLYYLLGTIALVVYLRSNRSLLKLKLTGIRLRWAMFRDILRVGLLGSVSTFSTNLTIGIATALAGHFGASAIAGYGTASRLEYLLVPLVFGLGAPLLAMVGTCLGAGQRERAMRAAWAGAALAFALTESIGLLAALFPRPWLQLFGSDPGMLDTGTQYLQAAGPMYGFFGVGLVLYFASQGAGRLFWPVMGNLVRLAVAAIGGWLALRWGGNLAQVFAMQGVAMVAYGVVIVAAIAGGAWFGRVGWPRTTAGMLRRLQRA